VPFGSLRRRQRHLTTLHDEEPDCLAHMASHDNDLFEAELRRINEYGVIDARGLSLTADLLDRILAAARNSHGHTVLRDARFDRATFDCVARFNELTFEG
jgi:hypothetical protein